MRTSSEFQPSVYRIAVLTAVAALVPITVGALVTTMNWGMAFADWPTSDGQNMFLYPWLQDLKANPGKFTEHGHRLGGAFIGFCSIALAFVCWRHETRTGVRWLGLSILGCVIVRGLLGGNRVLRDDPRMAMVHGAFASVVFTQMAILVLVSSRRWFLERDVATSESEVVPDWSRTFVLLAPALVLVQYLIGGSIRHLGLGLHEHLAGAVVVAGVCGFSALASRCSESELVRRTGFLLGLALVVQLLLGAGAWITRFGLATIGYVAVHQSPPQMIFRTAHTVIGMFVLASSSLLAFQVLARERLVAERLAAGSVSVSAPSILKGSV